MAGNVSEWTLDVYRPLTFGSLKDTEQQDLNPYRGNVFQSKIIDEDGNLVEKDSLGRMKYRDVEDEEVLDRENYKKGDVKDYRDDDDESIQYGYGVTTLINDESRVIKGGSWADRLFWLSPGTRRYKQENKSDRTLGFRCKMIRVGGPAGNEDTGGNMFKEGKKKVKRRYK